MKVPILTWVAAAMWAVCWFIAGPEKYTAPPAPDWVTAIRAHFASTVGRFGGDGADLLPGLVLGDTSHVSETLDESMRIASLSHLTAVSGANCAVIVSVVFGLCALGGFTLWWRVGISVLALAGFVVVVGAEPSVVRAAIMSITALIAIGSGFPVRGVVVLSGAVIAALCIAPSLAHSIGFGLSVAATLGLLTLTTPLSELLARWLPTRWALTLSVPVAAQIAVQPILLVFAPHISTYAVPANLIADPLAPIATVVGLLALALSPLPWLSLPMMWFGWVCSSLIASVAMTVTQLPFPTLPWPSGWQGIACATFVSVGLAWALVNHRVDIGVASGVLGLLALSTTVGAGAVSWVGSPREWSIAQCDVGQGDAVVLKDGPHIALIDTGREVQPIRDCLARLGVERIDLLVLTHFDIDHAGGYSAVVGRVDTVLHGPTDGIADEITLDDLRKGGAVVTDAHRGLTGQLGGWRWDVMWPRTGTAIEPGNPASVVMLFRAGSRCVDCIDLIDLGDLPAREQRSMLSLGGVTHTAVVKVSHHGSRDQEPQLYARLHSAIGLIGVGADNEYGHPTDVALELVKSNGGIPIRSDRAGIVMLLRSADGGIRVWTERAGWPAVH